MSKEFRAPEVRDTFVWRNEKYEGALTVTSVDHQKEEGTFKFFKSEQAARDFFSVKPAITEVIECLPGRSCHLWQMDYAGQTSEEIACVFCGKKGMKAHE